MKIANEWVRLLLLLGMYISCAGIVMILFRIPIELMSTGIIPLRLYAGLLVSVCILGVVVYCAEEPAWKTIIKLLAYVLALSSICIGGVGIILILKYLLGSPVLLPLYWSPILIIVGVVLY